MSPERMKSDSRLLPSFPESGPERQPHLDLWGRLQRHLHFTRVRTHWDTHRDQLRVVRSRSLAVPQQEGPPPGVGDSGALGHHEDPGPQILPAASSDGKCPGGRSKDGTEEMARKGEEGRRHSQP